MKYYRIKPENDNLRRSDGSILVRNELYTEKEMQRYKIPKEYAVLVEEKKSETYWKFGARFGKVKYYD